MDNVYVVTVATHSQGLYNTLINNEQNIKVNVLAYGEKWRGYKMKTEEVLKYMENLKDDDILIYLDAFDTIINGSLEDAVKRFKKTQKKILYSTCYDTYGKFAEMIFGSCQDGIILNCGLYMGYVKELKELFTEALRYECKDDQVTMNMLYKKFNIGLDVDKEIFENYENRSMDLNYNSLKKKINSNSIFIGLPGTITYDRFLRFIPEYAQFFFVPFFILVSILSAIFIYYKSYKLLGVLLFIAFYIYYISDKSCLGIYNEFKKN